MVDIDWTKLSFSFLPAKYMYRTTCEKEGEWEKGKIEPYGDIAISPSAGVLNYGQGLFEGIKAYGAKDGKRALLFRPELNAQRMADGCRRLCMPPITEEVFIHGVTEVVKANRGYVPPYVEGADAQPALYLRPVLWGTGPILGVAPAPFYTFLIFACPVGPYFKGGVHPIKLMVTTQYHRATPGGSGAVKAIGNYAASMLPGKNAKKQGYSEALYLDAKEDKYIEEVGAANFFCIKGNKIMTPSLDGSILPGITRLSILHLAKEKFNLTVEERKVSIDEALEADEAFASGTAAAISPIGIIHHKEKDHLINGGKVGEYTQKLYNSLITIQYGGEDPYNWMKEV